MNKKPVFYLQYDPRWKDKPYRAKGENSTIGSAGCGPTSAAMLIETITGKTFTPEDACNWSMKHGYKALHQGTYYSYFEAQFAAFGIECKMLNWINTYHKPKHSNHNEALRLLQNGYYLIALMNPGLWTRSGHFVVVWWQDGKVRINDPASTRDDRTNGNISTFRDQVKYYWYVDARSNIGKDDAPMANNDIASLTSCVGTGDHPSEWAKEATEYCQRKGIFNGNSKGDFGWQKPITREATAQIIYNLLEAMDALDKLPDV